MRIASEGKGRISSRGTTAADDCCRSRNHWCRTRQLALVSLAGEARPPILRALAFQK